VADLAAAAQNPIANLISLPFQNNTNFGVGPNNDRTQNVLNIQPVVPIPLSDDLLLVTRTILPVVAQPDFGGNGTVWGLGDLNPTFFFVPATQGNLTWGNNTDQFHPALVENTSRIEPPNTNGTPYHLRTDLTSAKAFMVLAAVAPLPESLRHNSRSLESCRRASHSGHPGGRERILPQGIRVADSQLLRHAVLLH
jgi:hypothetical protein